MARAKAAKSSARGAREARGASGARGAEAVDDLDGGESGLRFEEALAKLEAVVDRLEGGDLDLEASLAAFEEGVRLSRRCATQLDAAEQRVEVLVREAGALTRRLLEVGDEYDGVAADDAEDAEDGVPDADEGRF